MNSSPAAAVQNINNPLRFTGSWNGWSTAAENQVIGTTGVDSNIWDKETTIPAGSQTWMFRADGDWNRWGPFGGNLGGTQAYTLNTIGSSLFNGGSNNDPGAYTTTFAAGKIYTFRFDDKGYNSSTFTVMETDNSPVTITAVNSADTGSPYAFAPVRINVTISAAKSQQEKVIIRYTTDGWATSDTVLCDSTAATAYFGDIPGQSAGSRVIFYVLTSSAANSTNWDLQALNYNTGVNGANYTYRVIPPSKTHHTVYPPRGVYGVNGGGPQFSDNELMGRKGAALAGAWLTWDTSYITVAFAGGTTDNDKYNILIDTNPGLIQGTDTDFGGRGGWKTGYTPDVAYQILSSNVTRYWGSAAGWTGATAVTGTCSTYFGYNTGADGVSDTIIVSIPRSNFGNSINDTFSVYIYASSNADAVWGNWDNDSLGFNFDATDSVQVPNDTTPPAAPTGLAVSPSRSSTDSFAVSWTAPTDTSGIAGFYYKVRSAPNQDTDGIFVRGNSVAGVKAGFPVGSDSIYVWAVDRNRNASKDSKVYSTGAATMLNLYADSVVINEILAVDDPRVSTLDSYCFIELYNGGGTSVDISGWTLTDYTTTWTIPASTTLAAGNYLVQHMKTGTNYTDSYGAIHVFPSSPTTINPGTPGDTNSFGLYRSSVRDSTTVNDFVVLSTGTNAGNLNDSAAVAYGIWPEDTVATIASFSGFSAIRSGNGVDTDNPVNWIVNTSAPTWSPGFANGAAGKAPTAAQVTGTLSFKEKNYATDTNQASFGDTVFLAVSLSAGGVPYSDVPVIVYSSSDTILVSLRPTTPNSTDFIGHFRITSAYSGKKDNELFVVAPDIIYCTTVVGGGTLQYGQAADSLYILNNPIAPTVDATYMRILRQATFEDTTGMCAGDTIRIHARFEDLNGTNELTRGKVFVAIRNTTADSIVFKLETGVLSVVNGSESLYQTRSIETAVAGTTLSCIITATLQWNWSPSGSYALSAMAIDSTGLGSGWTDTTASYDYINALACSGTLAGNGLLHDTVTSGKFFKGSENVYWHGISVVYAGSTFTPDTDYFDIRLRDDNGTITDVDTNLAFLSCTAAVDAATDLTEQDSVFLINLPAGATFSDTRSSPTFAVDAVAPVITANRDSYTFKYPYVDSYGTIFDVDVSDADQHIDTIFMWLNTETQVVSSYGGASYTTNFKMTQTLYNTLSAGLNPVTITAVDSVGNVAQKTIYVAKEISPIDGDSAADWQPDEVITQRPSGTVRITWDDTSFYFSFGGVDGNLALNDWFIYFQTSTATTADSSYTSYNWNAEGTHTLPFGANYMIGIEDGSISNSQFRKNVGGTWTDSGVNNAEVYGGWATIPTTEYRIGWNRFGGKPDTMKVVVFPQQDVVATLAYGAAPPTVQEGAVSPATITDYLYYSKTSDTVAPNSQALHWSLKFSQSSVNVGDSFYITVAAVNSSGETMTGINAVMTLSVNEGAIDSTYLKLVNGVGIKYDSITLANGSVRVTATAANNSQESVTNSVFVSSNVVYGWHAAQLNEPDTGAGDADSFMRSVTRTDLGIDTMWPRRRTTDSTITFWSGKSAESKDTYTVVTMWYAVKNSGWTSIAPSETTVMLADSKTYYRFVLSQSNATGWDYNDTVSYYFRYVQTGKETTYITGSGAVDAVSDSNASLSETTARTLPFIYRIRSTNPSKVVTAVNPTDGQTTVASRRPTINWAAAVDVDTPAGDTIVDYFFEIASQPNMSDTGNFVADVGWLGSSNQFHTCTTTLNAYQWYYWRVRARDNAGFVSTFSDTFKFQINAIIAVDGQLNDWDATKEKFGDVQTTGRAFYFTWDSTNAYIAWVRGDAFETTDVVCCYIDVGAGGSDSTVNFNGGGQHRLPIRADTVVWYRQRDLSAGLNFHWWDGSTWQYGGSVGGSEYKNGGSNQLEFSFPWSKINVTDSFSVVIHTINEYNSNYIFSNLPVANRRGTATQDLACYLQYPFVPTSGITVNDKYYFRSKFKWTGAAYAVPSFSPYIDGVKDPGWGNTPSGVSPAYQKPNPGEGDTIIIVPPQGECRDVYVTNDAQWLYIGWQAFGDPFNLDAPSNTQQSAHYGFVITDTSPWGSPYDPWKATTVVTTNPGSTRVTGHGANVWENTFATFGNVNHSGANRYVSNGATWVEDGTLTANVDFAAYLTDLGRGWGEIKVPLSKISSTLKIGDTIAIIHYARHNASKDGIDDMTPFQTGVPSDYSANPAVMEFRDTGAIYYVIQQAVIDGYHVPDTSPFTGFRNMRTPDTAKASTTPNVVVRAKPAGVLTSAQVKYSTDSGGAWNSVSLSSEITNGGADYWSGLIPSAAKDSIVLYYFKLQSATQTTYVYGTETISYASSGEATAQTNAFRYSIANTAPNSPDSIDIRPGVPGANDSIIASASGASDSDAADVLRYRFDWYRNDTLALTTYDNTVPYTSIVPPESTSAGDTWYVLVAAGDGIETSAARHGPTVAVASLVSWPGTLPILPNTGRVVQTGSVSEWIWRDKDSDVRSLPRFDLREARIQVDTNYIYFLFRLGEVSVNGTHITVAIDTALDGSGGSMIGDQSNTLLGSGVSTPALRHNRQVAFHAVTSGTMTCEIDTGTGVDNWIAPPSGAVVSVNGPGGVIEARLARTDLLLKGPSTFRFAIATFGNNVGSAATIDATTSQTICDALDAASIATVGVNDTARQASSLAEDLSDGAVDAWFQLTLTDTWVKPNTAPGATPSQLPATGDTETSNPPTFTWGATSETDANDTVVCYLFELADSGTSLDFTVLYRSTIIGQLYTLPGLITDSKYYTWRVRAMDRAGNLGSAAAQTFFMKHQTAILVSAPTDISNFNNMNRENGDEVAGTTITWNWVPAVHSDSAPIDSYIVEIDTSTNFSPPLVTDTKAGSTRSYTYSGAVRDNTYYARLKAVDTGGFSSYSSSSDGIYVSRRKTDGDSSDWQSSSGMSSGSATLKTGEGIWKDTAGDQRTDVANSTSRDLTEFHVTADPYNLYFLVSTSAFVDGACIGQIATSYDNSSDIRAFEGTGTNTEDCYTVLEAAWEKNVKWRTGNNDVNIENTGYTGQPGRYTSNTGQKYVELCVPLALMGGSGNILGKTVKFSVGTFVNNNGAVGQNGTGMPTMVDAITDVAGNTWNDIGDQVLNYYLSVTFDTGGKVTSISGTSATSSAPSVANNNGAPFASNRDFILYNVFVDRFNSGRGDNTPGDPDMSGGDLQGLIDSMSYFNQMGVTGLYMSPICDYGGGVWGYNQSDLYGIQWSYRSPSSAYRGFDDLMALTKSAWNHNINLVMDWVPGQIYGGRTVTNHPEMFSGKRFGGERVMEDWTEGRQFFVDHSLVFAALGVKGFRADNTKFYDPGDDPNRGLPFYRYMRINWDKVFPGIYVFGEQPGGATDVGAYTRDGARMQGQLDFDYRWQVMNFANGTDAPSTFITNFTGSENGYSGTVEACMASLMENHDHSRTYHNFGGGGDNDGSKNSSVMDKMRLAYLVSALHSQPPIIFYGDEVPISGWHSWTYPFPGAFTTGTGQFGNTRKMPWTWLDGTWLRDAMRNEFTARAIFSEIRGARNAGRYLDATSANVLTYRRGEGNGDLHHIVGVMNNSGTDQTVNIPTGTNSTKYRDWLNSGAVGYSDATTGALNSWTVPYRNGFILIQGGYGRRTVHVSTGVANAICWIDNNTAWTRDADATGQAWIPKVVGWEGGVNYNRTLYAWAPGYTVHYKTIGLPAGGGDLAQQDETLNLVTVDNNGPPTPTGLTVKPRDRATFLRWEPVTDNPSEDITNHVTYYVYRSKTANDNNPARIIETLQPWFYDNDLDNFLTNGDTYYYKLRAVDRNGNLSGFSSEVACVPRKYTVKFYFEVEGSGLSNVTSVKIGGNIAALGHWDLLPMTQVDTTLWMYQTVIDPGVMIEFKYYVDGQGWEWDNVFNSNNVSYNRNGRPRLYTIRDHTGNGTCIFTNRWNYDGGNPTGDIPPRQVKNVIATGSPADIQIGWTPSPHPDVGRYIIRRSLDNATWTEIGDVVVTQNTYRDTNVSGGSTYYYEVRAVDWWNQGGDWSASSSATLVSSDTIAPSKPTGLAAYPVDTSSIRFTWNPNSDADVAGYSLYRSTDPTVPIVLSNRVNVSVVAATLSPTFTDTGITTGVQYYYRLVAVDQAGNSSVASDTLAEYVVAVRFELDLGVIAPSSAEITGSANSLGPSPSRVALQSLGTSAWGRTFGLLAGVPITYEFTYNNGAVNEADFLTSSKLREFTPPFAPSVTLSQDWEDAPNGPVDPFGYAGNQTAYLNWTNDSGVDVIGYTIERAEASDTTFRVITPTYIAKNSYIDTGLTNNETYYYLVRSLDGGNIQLLSEAGRMIAVTPQAPIWIRFRVDAERDRRRNMARRMP